MIEDVLLGKDFLLIYPHHANPRDFDRTIDKVTTDQKIDLRNIYVGIANRLPNGSDNEGIILFRKYDANLLEVPADSKRNIVQFLRQSFKLDPMNCRSEYANYLIEYQCLVREQERDSLGTLMFILGDLGEELINQALSNTDLSVSFK